MNRLLPAFFIIAIGASATVLVVALQVAPDPPPSPASEAVATTSDTAEIPTLAVRIPDVPLREGVPYVGADGTFEDGYPRRTADGEQLLALLRAREFERLTTAFDTYLAEYRADFRNEYVLGDAVGRVAPPDPSLGPALDAWAAAAPDSFAPYAARGAWHAALADVYRGTDLAADTSPLRFAKMRLELAQALPDLARAATLARDAAPVLAVGLRPARLLGDGARFDELVTRAERDCRACVIWRGIVLHYLTPQWGGDAASMRAFEDASVALATQNPRLGNFRRRTDLLYGYHRIETRRHPRWSDSLAVLDEVAGASTYWFFERERAKFLTYMQRYEPALEAVGRVLEQRPDDVTTLALQLRATWALHRWLDAHALAVRLARLQPAAPELHEFIERAVPAFPTLAYANLAEGHVEGARALLEATATFRPRDPFYLAFRPRFDADAARVAPIVAALTENPDDVEAVVALDRLYSELDVYRPVLARWDAYLARHPDDTRALSERCGTHSQLQQWAEAAHDCEEACRLGDRASCRGAGRFRELADRAAEAERARESRR